MASAHDRARSETPRTDLTAGRAMIVVITRRPNADITERKTSQRAIRSRGVAAVSLVEGTTNCGAGPGFGPIANVNAPRTGWPSAEMTRQKTRYQPSARWRTGTTSCAELAGDVVGGPDVCWWPAASVTETLARRGSVRSEYVSRTASGDWLTVVLASGLVRRRAACAHAAAGAASDAPTISARSVARPRRLMS